MARTPEQLARQRAQRANAAARRESRSVLGGQFNRGYRQAVAANANAIIAGTAPMPAPGTLEARSLASLAGKARWGKADPRYEAAFKHLWYHKKEA